MQPTRPRVLPSALMLCALLLTLFTLNVAPSPVAAAGTIRRVISAGGLTFGSCDSWANACDFQYALALSQGGSGGALWVAAGTYKPTALLVAGNPRSATFTLNESMSIYGGFAGLVTETLRTQRDWATNVVTLSGDLLGNDSAGLSGSSLMTNGTRTENSYHVVYVAQNTQATPAPILDGVTITGGNANASSNTSGMIGFLNYGGGMIFNIAPVLTNVNFSRNSAEYGGGLYSYYTGDITVLNNVIFSSNYASINGGGF